MGCSLQAPILGRHTIACTLGSVHYYIACTPLVLALVYCNFLTEVRLGSWGHEGPKASTFASPLECVRHNSVRK